MRYCHICTLVNPREQRSRSLRSYSQAEESACCRTCRDDDSWGEGISLKLRFLVGGQFPEADDLVGMTTFGRDVPEALQF
jgi:hypothetical protein